MLELGGTDNHRVLFGGFGVKSTTGICLPFIK